MKQFSPKKFLRFYNSYIVYLLNIKEAMKNVFVMKNRM